MKAAGMKTDNKKEAKIRVYISFDSVADKVFMPEARRKEIDSVTDEKLAESKIKTWNLLNFAVSHGLNKNPCNVKFTKNEYGKWEANGFYFSLSHTVGAVAVAVSDIPCGVDAEKISSFKQKCENEKYALSLAERIGEKYVDSNDLLKKWTGKESVYKAEGKGWFSPCKEKIDDKNVYYAEVGDYLVAATGRDSGFSVEGYLVIKGKAKKLETKFDE